MTFESNLGMAGTVNTEYRGMLEDEIIVKGIVYGKGTAQVLG